MKIFRLYLTVLFLTIFLSISTNIRADDARNINFLIITDFHLDSDQVEKAMEIAPSERHGERPKRTNDLDVKTLRKMLGVIRDDIKSSKLIKDPEFILILGDLPGHDRRTEEGIIDDIETAYRLLYDAFPNIPMFYVFGNHDSIRMRDGRFHDPNVQGGINSSFEISGQLKTGWRNGFLSTGKYCNAKKTVYPCLLHDSVNFMHGYYAAYVHPGVRLIALNNVMYLQHSKSKDPLSKHVLDQQIEWFESQLEDARKKKESVIVAAHVPLGYGTHGVLGDRYEFLKPEYRDKISRLLVDYEKEIATILVAHTHKDEIEVILNKANKEIVGDIVVLNPGMSTSHGNSPGIRQLYLSKKNNNWLLVDYETLRFNMPSENGVLSLEYLYNFRSRFCGDKQVNNLTDCIDIETLTSKVQEIYKVGNPNIELQITDPGGLIIEVEDVGSFMPGNVFNDVNLPGAERLFRRQINRLLWASKA